MTSISLPAAVPVLSPFDPAPGSPPKSPSARRRRSSRNTNALPLPISPLNSGLPEDAVGTGGMESPSRSLNDMAGETGGRSPRLPPPLPDFTFNPGAGVPPEPSPSPTHPVLQEMVLNQQRAVRSARPAPLPAFAFNPSSAISASPSPTKATFGDVQQPARGGHRRGGSEFVGGGGTDGPQLVNNSPEKPEYRPNLPISGGRGHAHRRSQAVSISDADTSELIKVNAVAKARAGSSPTTPSDRAQVFAFPPTSPQMRQSISATVRTPPSSPRRRGSAPGVRPRVGFSDHVDVIPRPLSMISSETEGSNSTVRGCHSLSGSINSIAASPRPQPTFVVTSSIESPETPPRPQTADALSSLTPSMAADNPLSMINLPKRPLSASGSPGTVSSGSSPNKKKYFWFNHSGTNSPCTTPETECCDPMEVSSSPPSMLALPRDELRRPRTSSGGSASKKRKYHNWKPGIFSRKSEKRAGKAKPRDTPAPPPLTRTSSARLNEIFDTDDTIVLREPSPVASSARCPLPNLTTPPSCSSTTPEEQVTSPILDLDAALGPFGSEEKFGHESASKLPPKFAKLHSTERRGSADAFGVHRRTESAPTMPAINRNNFGLHHIGSNTSLSEDVFDEEEEDNFLATENAVPGSPTVRRDEGGSAIPLPARLLETEATDGLGLNLHNNPSDGIIIVDPEDEIAQIQANRSSNSTIEAPVFHDFQTQKRPMSSAMSFAFPAPQSHYASSTDGRTTSASMVSSPDAEHVSFETMPRPLRLLSEPSPDMVLRASIDDLPSLSDSTSSGAALRFSSSGSTRQSVEQRSNSVIVPSTSRSNTSQAWKRSSLASLNRLIPGSSNGSKLKFETVPDVPPMDEKSRKKTNRLSKLMHFWRSKEKTAN